MKKLGLVGLAVLAVAAWCPAQTWDEEFNFDDTADFCSQCINTTTGNYRDAVYEDTGSSRAVKFIQSVANEATSSLELGEGIDGALKIKAATTTEGLFSYQGTTPFTTDQGWTFEFRARIDPNTDQRFLDGDRSPLIFKIYTTEYSTLPWVGGNNGPDICGQSPSWSSSEIDADPTNEFGLASWEPPDGDSELRDGAAAKIIERRLIERTSDWHVYRVIYDPTITTDYAVEMYVDGELILHNRARPKNDPKFEFGPKIDSDGGTYDDSVLIDYIKYANNQVVRPSTSTFSEPLLKNRYFNNIRDQGGFATDFGNTIAPFWIVDVVTLYDGTPGNPGIIIISEWAPQTPLSPDERCEPYAKNLSVNTGDVYWVWVEQRLLDVGTNKNITFTGSLHATTGDTVVYGRVGIDPTGVPGAGCNNNLSNNNIVWSAPVAIDQANVSNCQTLSVSATSTDPNVCVYIEGNAPNDSASDQFTYFGGSSVSVEDACGNPAQDYNGDNDVDVADFAQFQRCFSGPGVLYPTGATYEYCPCFDVASDLDVDVADFSAFQLCFSAPGTTSPCYVP
jgi:hypothetical protein